MGLLIHPSIYPPFIHPPLIHRYIHTSISAQYSNQIIWNVWNRHVRFVLSHIHKYKIRKYIKPSRIQSQFQFQFQEGNISPYLTLAAQTSTETNVECKPRLSQETRQKTKAPLPSQKGEQNKKKTLPSLLFPQKKKKRNQKKVKERKRKAKTFPIQPHPTLPYSINSTQLNSTQHQFTVTLIPFESNLGETFIKSCTTTTSPNPVSNASSRNRPGINSAASVRCNSQYAKLSPAH